MISRQTYNCSVLHAASRYQRGFWLAWMLFALPIVAAPTVTFTDDGGMKIVHVEGVEVVGTNFVRMEFSTNGRDWQLFTVLMDSRPQTFPVNFSKAQFRFNDAATPMLTAKKVTGQKVSWPERKPNVVKARSPKHKEQRRAAKPFIPPPPNPF